MMLPVYSKQQMLLHWVSAAVILWTLVTGFYVANINVANDTKQWVAGVNVSLTTLFIPVFCWRLVLFVRHLRHERMAQVSPGKMLAMVVHRLIYVLVVVVLLSGVLMMDRPIPVFGLLEFPQPLNDVALTDGFFVLHIWACTGLAVLVAMHIGAVILHELRGYRVLRRMSWRSRIRQACGRSG